jgi:uncharacterized protein (DUF2225 family)
MSVTGASGVDEDLYLCRSCDVTFHEPFPQFYDVTPCPRCGASARNVWLLTAGRNAAATS